METGLNSSELCITWWKYIGRWSVYAYTVHSQKDSFSHAEKCNIFVIYHKLFHCHLDLGWVLCEENIWVVHGKDVRTRWEKSPVYKWVLQHTATVNVVGGANSSFWKEKLFCFQLAWSTLLLKLLGTVFLYTEVGYGFFPVLGQALTLCTKHGGFHSGKNLQLGTYSWYSLTHL